MANIRFADYAQTTLAAAVTQFQVTILVTDITQIPSVGGGIYCYLTLIDANSVLNNIIPPTVREIVKATAISGNTVTVVRSQGGTTGQNFAAGDYCMVRVCTAALNDIANGNSGGTVTSVSNNDGSMTISPTTGSVIASLNTNFLAPVAISGAYSDLTGKPSLAAIATSGSASDLTTGTVSAARLPNPSSTTLGGVQSTVTTSHQWVDGISTAGVPSKSQPAFTDISGNLAAAQLPDPTLSTKGGIKAIDAVGSRWINSIDGSGNPTLSQPAFTDISGSVAAAQLPNPSTSSLGGIQAINAVANNWIRSINTSGVPQLAQPAFTNVSGSVAATQMPALTGDVTSSAGAVATTLATVNSNVGTFGNSSNISQVTVNAKGQIIAVSNVAIASSGNVNAGTDNQLAYYATAGTQVSGQTLLQALNFPVLTGDVTTVGGSLATVVNNLKRAGTVAGYTTWSVDVTPGSPSAGHLAVWAQSGGGGQTINVKNSSGAVTHTVKTKNAVTSEFLTSIIDDGTIISAPVLQSDIAALTTSSTPTFAGVTLSINPTPHYGGYVTNRYYSPFCDLSSTNGLALSVNNIYVTPFSTSAPITWTKIGVRVSVLGAGNARLGIYNMVGGAPTSLVLDAGTVDISTTGVKEITISQALPAGPYCLVIVPSVNVTVYGKSAADMQRATGTGTIGAADYQLYQAFVYAALASTFGAVSYQSGEAPNLWLRY